MNAVRLGLLLLLFLAPEITARAQTPDPLPPEVQAGIRKAPRFSILADVNLPALERAVGNDLPQPENPDGKFDPRKEVRRVLGELLEIGTFSNRFNGKDPVLKGMIGPDGRIDRFVLILDNGRSSSHGICFIIGDFQNGTLASSPSVEMKTVAGRDYFLAMPQATGNKDNESPGQRNAYVRLSERTFCVGDEPLIRAILEETSDTSANEDLIAGLDRVNGFVRLAVRLDEVDCEPSAEFTGLKRVLLGIELVNESFQATGFIQSDNAAGAEQAMVQLSALKKELAEGLKKGEENILLRESPSQILARVELTRNGLETHFKFGEEVILLAMN